MSNTNLRRCVSVFIVIVMAGFFAVTDKTFLTQRNMIMLFKDAAYVGLVALGTCFIMVGGGIDMSSAGIICFVGMLATRLCYHGLPALVVIPVGMIVGALCGFINAFIAVKLQMSEFVITYATSSIWTGAALLVAFRDGNAVVSKAITTRGFLALGKTLGGIYWITIAWVVCTIVMQIVMRSTKFGRYTVSIGSNSKAAAMSGVGIPTQKLVGFMIGGAFAAMASLFVVSYQQSASIALGSGVAFEAVAACVVGGIVLTGGRGDPLAAFLGSLIMTIISNGLMKLGLSTGLTSVVKGLIILLALNFDAVINGVSAKLRARKEQI